jgi:predicted short-subunit dehydrogenase-like oxidoreductase (DUF2520 family)
VAKHFAHYLSLAGIPYETWPRSRALGEDFALRASRAERIWILVSDSAIETVGENIRAIIRVHCESDREPCLLHASGATVVPGLRGVHPLMTFGPDLYDLETYRHIPFLIEDQADGTSADEILGGLPNVGTFLAASERPLYHALVSVSGNFAAILWAEVFDRFERELGLSRDLLVPYLFRTLMNTVQRGEDALTGPLLRGDRETVRRHRSALSALPGGYALDSLYGAFESFLRENDRNPRENDYEQH